MSIRENILNIKDRIEKSAQKAGRDPSEITLIGVTKQVKYDRISEALQNGLNQFGENYAQEFRDKYNLLKDHNSRIKWHFIGHLQKNKIKYVVDKVDLIHSVDNMQLAKELNKRAENLDKNINVLIEINSGGEENKIGINFGEAKKLLKKINEFKHLHVKGFMTMTPYFDDPEKARPFFKQLREFRDQMLEKFPSVKELSMGMSSDFEIAIEEGATIVRIGSAIFGPRQY